MYSGDYVECLRRGPFPGRIDPWAEIGRYFQQIHSGMLDQFLGQMQPRLLEMGYLVGKEASLQIAEGREPDIYVQRAMNAPRPDLRWNYDLAAEEILAEPGIVVEAGVDLQALHIKRQEHGRLVTVVELISPNNKTKPEIVTDYRMRRERLVLEQGVNVVEIDLTCSVKRLLNHPFASQTAYHIAIYLPDDSPRLIGMDYGQALKRFALPLRGEVFPIELQTAYDHAYRLVAIGGQIADAGDYSEDKLPFPSLLTAAQIRVALDTVAVWKQELEQLRNTPHD